jgi:adenylate kinase family enzyme
MAWMGEQLPCFYEGTNYLPTIHVRDLASIVYYLVTHPEIDHRYMIAVDQSHITLCDLVFAISQVYEVPSHPQLSYLNSKDDILLYDHIDYLLMDVHFETTIIREVMNEIEWYCNGGIVEQIQAIRKEYESRRNLSPLKIMITGPPLSGKSYFAHALSKDYKLPLVTTQNVIAEYFKPETDAKNELEPILQRKQLREQRKKERDEYDKQKKKNKTLQPPPHYNDPIDTAAEEQDIKAIERCQSTINSYKSIRKQVVDQKSMRFNDIALTFIFNWKLSQRECRIKGWVMENYPKTIEQAKSLMIVGEKETTLPQAPTEEDPSSKSPKSPKSPKPSKSPANNSATNHNASKNNLLMSPKSTKNSTTSQSQSNNTFQSTGESEIPANKEPSELFAKKYTFATNIIQLDPTNQVLQERLSYVQSSSDNVNKITQEFEERLNSYNHRVQEYNVVDFLSQVKSEESTIVNEETVTLVDVDNGIEDQLEQHTITSIYPSVLKLKIEEEDDESTIYNHLVQFIGPAHNYGPSQEDMNKMKKEQEQRKRIEQAEMEQEQREIQEYEAAQREIEEKQLKKEEERVQGILRQEQEELEIRCKPLQQYLIDHVIPVLTLGLIDVMNVQPDNPVEHLAYYLRKHNPQQ